MNLKLKENKKNFVFGDLLVGIGGGSHYLLQSNLFYYAPKTNLNYIGTLNDVGVKVFTLKDFIEFEGGLLNLMTNKNSFTEVKTNMASFIENDDFLQSKNLFNGL